MLELHLQDYVSDPLYRGVRTARPAGRKYDILAEPPRDLAAKIAANLKAMMATELIADGEVAIVGAPTVFTFPLVRQGEEVVIGAPEPFEVYQLVLQLVTSSPAVQAVWYFGQFGWQLVFWSPVS
ncbi:hypothetical protein D6833_05730 [Candidatus Parcubacteria bacterium]|nr:MAG: hypothetical protein D6833_05730 [Candidatus Parcubacteria bacterium]